MSNKNGLDARNYGQIGMELSKFKAVVDAKNATEIVNIILRNNYKTEMDA